MAFTIRSTTRDGVRTETWVDGTGPDAQDTATRHARHQDRTRDNVTVTGPDGREVDFREGGA